MPPYLRLVEASACWNASKMIRCFSGGMPMPVSATSNATTVGACFRTGWSGLQPPIAGETVQPHAALLGELERVRQQVLQHLLQALAVGDHAAVEVGSSCTSNDRLRLSASCRNGRATMSSRLVKKISSASTETVPDSIFDRSRMSLIRFSRSVPAPWMVRANSTCLP